MQDKLCCYFHDFNLACCEMQAFQLCIIIYQSVFEIHTLLVSDIRLLKGAVSRSYHDFERFKYTPRSYINQQKGFYFGKHRSTNDNNPLGSEDG